MISCYQPGTADLTADVNFMQLRQAFRGAREVDSAQVCT